MHSLDPIAKSAPMVRDLSRPEALPTRTESVDVLETHISWLFFAGNRVYKVKKPVRTPFLDYTTCAARKFFCREEVRLNRRLAPAVYLGVVDVHRDADGCNIAGRGPIVDHAVEMTRLPEKCLLDRRLAEGRVSDRLAEDLAEWLHVFHQNSATGPGVDEHGTLERIRATDRATREGIAEISADPHRRSKIPSTLLRALSSRAERFLQRNETLFHRRVTEHRVREGHGDLHAGNLCIQDDGKIIAYDCIEFSAALRCLDEAAELAFLTMDLSRRGHRRLAKELTRASIDRSRDPDRARLQPFYEAHYAMVRTHVALIRGQQLPPDSDAAQLAGEEAQSALVQAWVCGDSSRLFLVCGLPGTGKSTLARDLARVFSMHHLQSDAVRKSLFGFEATQRCPPERVAEVYSKESTRRTYSALLEQARNRLRTGENVVVDANFPTVALRAPFLELARSHPTGALWIECTAPEATVLQRLERRQYDPHECSDADFAVYRLSREQFDPLDEIPDRARLSIDADVTTLDRHTAIALRLAERELARAD